MVVVILCGYGRALSRNCGRAQEIGGVDAREDATEEVEQKYCFLDGEEIHD